MLKKVAVEPNQIRERLGQEVLGPVSGHELNGRVVLMDPAYPRLFGLELEGEINDTKDTKPEGQI